MQESVTAAWGYLKTSLSRDEHLAALWRDSPGRAYLVEHYNQTDQGLADGPGEPGFSLEGRPGEGSSRPLEEGLRPPELEIGNVGEATCEPSGPTDHELLSALEVRMHLPEGGVPKEGPSAGMAVAVSLLSALTLTPVVPRVALSGEITLTGQILAVGGLKEKLLAALREGVRTVILPADVKPQIKEVPAELTRGLEIAYVTEFIDVLPHVFHVDEESPTGVVGTS
jgi:hypothetical protein